MVQCPHCGYLIPETWTSCKRCGAPTFAPAPAPTAQPAPDPHAYSSPARWSPPEHPPVVIKEAPPVDWWRQPATSLFATGLGFVLVLAAAFALPWMRIGVGIFHVELSYKQMQDLLSSNDFFSRVALDLGPLILLADLILVGWQLASRGRIGMEALAAPIGLVVLDLYVAMQIHGFAGNINGELTGTGFGVQAGVAWGPWVCLLGCACLAVGAVTGSPRTLSSRGGGI
jgi:hypothetical protein